MGNVAGNRRSARFLLQITAPLPEHPDSCRFEGVYTGSAGQAPLGWSGQRRRRAASSAGARGR